MVEIEVGRDYDGYFEAYTNEALYKLELRNIKKIKVSSGPWRSYAVSCKLQGEEPLISGWKEWLMNSKGGGGMSEEEYEREHTLNPDVCEVDYYAATREGFGDLSMEMVRDCIEQCDIMSGRIKSLK